MKKEPPPSYPLFSHHRRRVASFSSKNFTRPTAYVVLLLILSYSLGYLSAPYSNSQPSPAVQREEEVAEDPSITAATAIAVSDNDHYQFGAQCADPVPSKLVRRTILDKVFNGTSPYDNFPPPHAASLLQQKRIRGWGSYGAVFDNLIRKVQPKTIIEVGTFLGASAIHMAKVANGLGLNTQIVCVDDFRGWPGFRDQFSNMGMLNGDVLLMYQFMQNVLNASATESILFLPFSTGSALGSLCEWGLFGDLVVVDAGHDFHSAWSDINRAYKLLRPGGVIFGHDYFTAADNKGVRRAVNLFARVHGLRVRPDGQHWVIESA